MLNFRSYIKLKEIFDYNYSSRILEVLKLAEKKAIILSFSDLGLVYENTFEGFYYDEFFKSVFLDEKESETVRLLALKEIVDQDFIKKITLKHSYSDAIIATAVSLLSTQEDLKKQAFLGSSNQIKLAAISKIDDYDFLRDIFWGRTIDDSLRLNFLKLNLNIDFYMSVSIDEQFSVEVRELALTRALIIASFNLSVFQNNQEFYKIAQEKLSDGKFYKVVALRSDEDIAERIHVLNLIKDQEFLKTMALEAEEDVLRYSAIKLVNDQEFFKAFVLSKGDDFLRFYALSKIKDQNYCRKIAEKDASAVIREKYVKDADDLYYKEIVLNPDEDQERKISAIASISDSDFLVGLFNNSQINDTIKLKIVENILDESFFKKMIEQDGLSDAIYEKLFSHEFEEEFYSQIVIEHPNQFFRRMSINFVEDDEILKEIIKTSDDIVVKKIAIHKIHDIKHLNLLQSESISEELKDLVSQRLTELKDYQEWGYENYLDN